MTPNKNKNKITTCIFITTSTMLLDISICMLCCKIQVSFHVISNLNCIQHPHLVVNSDLYSKEKCFTFFFILGFFIDIFCNYISNLNNTYSSRNVSLQFPTGSKQDLTGRSLISDHFHCVYFLIRKKKSSLHFLFRKILSCKIVS